MRPTQLLVRTESRNKSSHATTKSPRRGTTFGPETSLRPNKIKHLPAPHPRKVSKMGVSFLVNVGPDAGATVTSMRETAVSAEPFPVEEPSGRDPALETALAAARERGRLRAAEVLARDDMLSADALAEL